MSKKTQPIKVVISSKTNLMKKYNTDFPKITKLLDELAQDDKKHDLDTKIIYIDDDASVGKYKLKKVSSVTSKNVKSIVDEIYMKLKPGYLVILGAQDIIPFCNLANIAGDEDANVPSDLPYACDAKYSTVIGSYTGPSRVVGRIPDAMGVKSLEHFSNYFASIKKFKRYKPTATVPYFAITAKVWKGSTTLNLEAMFNTASNLKESPTAAPPFTATQLKPKFHFYNCHGASADGNFYGQQGQSYPVSQASGSIESKVTLGTVVAAECCYGAQLYDYSLLSRAKGICTTYLDNGAIAFVGSSNIAYGPADSLGSADLITQYFMLNVKNGASTGRAFLEARQQFITACNGQISAEELKTLGQFYLLGDPSIVVVDVVVKSFDETLASRRIDLHQKGISLKKTVAPSKKFSGKFNPSSVQGLKEVLKKHNFSGKENHQVYETKANPTQKNLYSKSLGADQKTKSVSFHKSGKLVDGSIGTKEILVIKELNGQILSSRLYQRK